MSPERTRIYNLASAAAVTGSRRYLAIYLWLAGAHGRGFRKALAAQCAYIGWPVRKRPNGNFR